MKIESSDLGTITWKKGKSPKSSRDSVIKYDETTNEVKFEFKSYENLI